MTEAEIMPSLLRFAARSPVHNNAHPPLALAVPHTPRPPARSSASACVYITTALVLLLPASKQLLTTTTLSLLLYQQLLCTAGVSGAVYVLDRTPVVYFLAMFAKLQVSGWCQLCFSHTKHDTTCDSTFVGAREKTTHIHTTFTHTILTHKSTRHIA